MDLQTIIICTAIASMTLCFTMGMAWQSHKASNYIFHWMCAGACFLVSNLTAFVCIKLDVQGLLHPGIANVLYMAGHAFITSGIALYIYGKAPPYLATGVALFTLLLHLSPDFRGSVDARFIILTPVVVMLSGASITMLWHTAMRKKGRFLWPLLITITIFALQMLIRTVALLTSHDALAFTGNDIFQIAGSLAVITFISMLAVTLNYVINGEHQQMLKKLSDTDFLTGWLNRKALEPCAFSCLDTAQRTGHTFGIIIFDVDHFKAINDKWGHHAGDVALQQITSRAKDIVRDEDNCFRIGGEEFLIILTRCNAEQLQRVSERLRQSVASRPVMMNDKPMNITISIGSALSRHDDSGWQALFDRADKALYQSKAEGRNTVSISEPEHTAEVWQ